MVFHLWRGDHCPRAMTITSLLGSGCGLGHESAEDGFNGTSEKLEALNHKEIWYIKGIHMLKQTFIQKNSAVIIG